MKSLLYLGIVALCALPARGEETAEERTLHTLTVIDSSLTREDLDTLLEDPLETVILYATDLNYDPGAQLRAIRALPAYCETDCDRVRATLRTLIPTDPLVQAQITLSRPLLRLRAAVEALGATGTTLEADITLVSQLLDHPSRDIRATAVRALVVSESRLDDPVDPDVAKLRCDLINALRDRLSVERMPQVQIALTVALQPIDADDCLPTP